jgi:WD40 repeat protein
MAYTLDPISHSEKGNAHNMATLSQQGKIASGELVMHPGATIGEGSFAVVRRGKYSAGGATHEVAVKTLRVDNMTAMSARILLWELEQEASVRASLHSRYLVQFYGLCTDGPAPMIVLELMDRSLATWLHTTDAATNGWPTRVRVCAEMTKGLMFLHSNNILHRDLKSPNVLLTRGTNEAKLTDFGVAKPKGVSEPSGSASTLAAVGYRPGSLAWNAPELLKKGEKATIASDVYALGMTIWEVCSRQFPFASLINSDIATRLAQGERETIPTDTPRSLVVALGGATSGCWASEPKARSTLRVLLDLIDRATSEAGGVEGVGVHAAQSPAKASAAVTSVDPALNSSSSSSSSNGVTVQQQQQQQQQQPPRAVEKQSAESAAAEEHPQQQQQQQEQQQEQEAAPVAVLELGSSAAALHLVASSSSDAQAGATGESGAAEGSATAESGKDAAPASDPNAKIGEEGWRGEVGPYMQDHTNFISCMLLTPDGRYVVSGSWDQTMKVFEVGTWKCVATLRGHTGTITHMVATKDCRYLVSAGSDNNVRVWDMASWECVTTLQGHTKSVSCLLLTVDEKHVVSASWDKTLRVWEMGTWACVATLEGHTDDVSNVTQTLDGKFLASGGLDNTVRIWEAGSWQPVTTLVGHTGRVSALEVTLDGQYLVSASWDKNIRVWEICSWTCVATLKGHTDNIYCLVLMPDGKHIVSGSSDTTLRVWEVGGTWQCVATMEGHKGAVRVLQATPDGKHVVSASLDCSLSVWEMGSWRCLNTLEVHDNWVVAAVVTLDAKFIVSGSMDTTVQVWCA